MDLCKMIIRNKRRYSRYYANTYPKKKKKRYKANNHKPASINKNMVHQLGDNMSVDDSQIIQPDYSFN